jgi:hypothetical protein
MICTHCRGDLQQRKARIDERRRQAPATTGKPCPQCGAAMEKDYYTYCRACYFAQPTTPPARIAGPEYSSSYPEDHPLYVPW